MPPFFHGEIRQNPIHSWSNAGPMRAVGAVAGRRGRNGFVTWGGEKDLGLAAEMDWTLPMYVLIRVSLLIRIYIYILSFLCLMFFHLFIYLSIYLFIYLSVYVSIYLFI